MRCNPSTALFRTQPRPLRRKTGDELFCRSLRLQMLLLLQAPDQFTLSHLSSAADPICAITAQQHLLLVARSSGVVHAFSLPTLNMEGQYVLRCRPQRLQLNCDCSRMAVVDFAGVLSLMIMTQAGPGKLQAEQLSLERKVCTCLHMVVRRPLAQALRRSRRRWASVEHDVCE